MVRIPDSGRGLGLDWAVMQIKLLPISVITFSNVTPISRQLNQKDDLFIQNMRSPAGIGRQLGGIAYAIEHNNMLF